MFQFIDSMELNLIQGWCSRNYLDVALLRLHNLERNDYGRKSSGFLGFMKDNRSESEADHLKATAVRCYGRIATQTPVAELLLKVLNTIPRTSYSRSHKFLEGGGAAGFYPISLAFLFVFFYEGERLRILLGRFHCSTVRDSKQFYQIRSKFFYC